MGSGREVLVLLGFDGLRGVGFGSKLGEIGSDFWCD